MPKFILLSLACMVTFAISLKAEQMAPELMDLLNEDPSLLLDPGTQITNPPGVSLPVEPERKPASAESPSEEKPKLKPTSEEITQATVSVEPSDSEAESESIPQPGAFQVSFTISSPPVVEVPPEPVVASPGAKVHSELEALPGVGDHAIILDGEQFFPASIKMKAGSKGRLLFITTRQKPAALVFVRPAIQRWISSSDSSPTKKPLEEFRELSSEKIAQIPFEAEPGVYEFYDALSGAKGEIKVE